MANTQKKSSGVPLFGERGAFSISPLVDAATTAFITMSSVDTNNSNTASAKAGKTIMMAYAPITGVNVKQSVDFSLTKGLNKDYLVYTFGDSVVTITLSGINFYKITKCQEQYFGKNTYKSVMEFYKNNKLSTNLRKRVDIAISDPSGTSTFRCALIGLTVSNDSSNDISGSAYAYSMTLIGVAR